jgi:hypothetical protein
MAPGVWIQQSRGQTNFGDTSMMLCTSIPAPPGMCLRDDPLLLISCTMLYGHVDACAKFAIVLF